MIGGSWRPRRAALALLASFVALVGFVPLVSAAHDLPRYQLPWGLGVAHRVGGNWYGEGRHTGAGDRYALDFDLKYEPVLAAQAGTVARAVASYPDPGPRACYAQTGYGNYVAVDHAGGYRTIYAHLSAVAVSAGTPVTQGQRIGVSGNTGRSCGAHLHFAVRRYGVAHRPEPLGGYARFPHDHVRRYLSKNSDTLTDLFLYDGATGEVLFADGAGRWRPGQPASLPGGWRVTRGRFNRDRPGDLFLYDGAATGQVLLANGSGGWTAGPVAALAANWEVHPGMFNADTLTDLALYDVASGAGLVLFADGGGGWTYAAPQTLPAGRTVVVGAFDANGLADLLLYDPAVGTAEVLLADGSGGWARQAARAFPPGGTLVTGRFNPDALTDVFLYAGATGHVLFANGAGGWTPAGAAVVPGGAQVHAAGFNADALTDLLFYDAAGTAQVLFADGLGGWVAGPAIPLGANLQVHPGTYDGDALTDVFVYGAAGQVLFADGAGGWRAGAPDESLVPGWGVYPASFGNGP